MDVSALRGVEGDGAVQAVFAAFFEGDADHAGGGIGVVVGSGDGYDLDFLNLLGAQRAQVGEQLFVVHLQFAVVDEDFRAAFAVDGDLLAVDPDAGGLFEQIDAVLAERCRGVCHVDDEPVVFAAHETGRDDDILDPGCGASEDEVTQIVVRFDADRLPEWFESQELDLEGVLSGGGLQSETPFGVGCHAGHLSALPDQDDRGIFDGLPLLVDDASVSRAESGGRSLDGVDDHHDPKDPLFHALCRVLARWPVYFTSQRYVKIFVLCNA